jgi:hypothetical protein
MSFVLNTLLQAKYNLLHSLPTPAAASPMEIMNLNGKKPAYMIVASMLNAGHSALKQYSEHTVVTLREIKDDMAQDHPTSGILTLKACDELFNRTPTSIRPVSFNKATLTDLPHQVSPPSSQSSRESRRAVAAYRQEVDLMQTPSLLQDTPSLKLKHPVPRSQQAYQSPPPMQIQSPQYTSPSFHNRTLFATPNTPQGPLGSPIQSSPDSPK